MKGVTKLLNGHAVAPLMLDALKELLRYSDVTSVHWAQTLDSGAGDSWGLITEDGHVKASFNALWLFEKVLPAAANQSRVEVESGDGEAAGCVGHIASANGTHAVLLVWRAIDCAGQTSPKAMQLDVSVALGSVFNGKDAKGTLTEISAVSASYLDNRSSEWLRPTPLGGVRREGMEWEGTLCAGCVLAFAFEAV